ncbi:MAG TPA: AAA family ATPase, partial [Polyangia bacterium]|nr:AAA family ATPase [Polyangia bacterium]
RVALKTIAARSNGSLLRFKHEFRALRGIEHPNLVGLGELMQDAGRWFFTMELVEGVDFLEYVRGAKSLSERLGEADTDDGRRGFVDDGKLGDGTVQPRAGRCDEAKLRASLEQLVHGLNALHRAGKVHRDIKPSNILVTPEGRVAILDFGLVADVTRAPSDEGDLAGTVAFMAPEQGTVAPITPAADWYSVGMLLYLALTGRVPFAGPPPEVLTLKRSVDPIAPRTLIPSVPADLDELCLALLRRAPDARPSGRQVLHWLRAAAPVATAEASDTAPRFVGRQAPLAQLHAALAHVAHGHTVSLLIDGESGVGKTALVQEFCQRVRGAGDALILRGRCYERESVPYKAFDEIVDALSRHLTSLSPADAAELLPPSDMGALAQIFPVLAPLANVANGPAPTHESTVALAGEPQQLRRAVFATLREILRRLSAHRLTIVHIDDLHWADEESLLLLEALLDPPNAPPLLLVATLRRDVGVPVDEVAACLPGDVRRLSLDLLSADEARLLAAELLRGSSLPPLTDDVAREAGGHPLFIEALVQHRLAVGCDRGPARLEDALAARIARLPDGARRLVELVAVAGGPIEQDVAAAAVELEWSELERQLAFLRASFLVRSTGARPSDRVETYHDRVRETVLQQLATGAERHWHEQLARAFERHERGDAETLAMHLRAAGKRMRAAHYFALAADRARDVLAFDRAARLYQECLALASDGSDGSDGAGIGALKLALADALANGGRGEAAARAYEAAAAAEPSPIGALDLRRRAAEQLLRVGRIDEAMALLRSVMSAVGLRMPATPAAALFELVARMAQLRLRRFRFTEREAGALSPLERARIDTCWSIGVGLSTIDHIQGAVFQERHLLLALRGGEPYRVARALIVETFLLTSRGAMARRLAQRLTDEAEPIVRRLDSPYLDALLCMSRAIQAQFGGHFLPARILWNEAERLLRTRCNHVAWELTNVGFFQLQTLAWLGELPALSRRLPLMLDAAQARGDRYSACVLRTGWNVLPGLAADEPVSTRRAVTEGVAGWPNAVMHVQHALGLHAHAQLALYEGRCDAAHALLERHWPALRRSLLLEVHPLRLDLLSLKMRCALACADGRANTTARLAEAERLAHRILRHRLPWSTPLAQLGLAAVAARQNRPDRALHLLDEARYRLKSRAMGLFAVAADRARAQLAGSTGDLHAADSAFAALGVRAPDRMTALLVPGFSR